MMTQETEKVRKQMQIVCIDDLVPQDHLLRIIDKLMEELRKYKIAALIGIIVMGIGAFMACLCTTSSLIMTGNVLLIASIFVLIYAFSSWQP